MRPSNPAPETAEGPPSVSRDEQPSEFEMTAGADSIHLPLTLPRRVPTLLPLAAAFLILVVTASGVSLWVGHRPSQPDGFRAIRHARFPNEMARSDDNTLPPTSELVETATRLRTRLTARQDTSDVLALARVLFILGRFNEAVTVIENAGRDDVGSTLKSALAALHLERYKASAERDDLLIAVRHAQDAVTQDPASPDANFNFAASLEALHLREEATAAWRQYLTLETDSHWIGEGRDRLRVLAAATVKRRWKEALSRFEQSIRAGDTAAADEIARTFPQEARTRAENHALDLWGSASDNTALSFARFVGGSLASRDALVRDAVAVIDDAIARRDKKRIESLRLAHRRYSEARAAYERVEVEIAYEAASEAAEVFREVQSPFALRADLLVASCLFLMNDLAGAQRVVDRVERNGGSRLPIYPSVAGQLQWLRGLVSIVQGRPASAVEDYTHAARELDRAGETENTAAVYGLLAEAYEYLGDQETAFRDRQRALQLISTLGAPKRMHQIASEAADALLIEHPAIALLYQNAIVRLSSTWGHENVVDALTWRALIHHRLGQRELARSDIRDARHALVRIAEPNRRARIEADIDAAEGVVIAAADPDTATQHLTRAIDFFAGEGNSFHAARLLLERGRCHVARKDDHSAESDFERGMTLLETYRTGIDDTDLRISFFERGEALFDEAIALAMRRSEIERAFIIAERARARALLDTLATAETNLGVQRAPGAIREHLPQSTAIVEYAVLPERLIAWVVRRNKIDVVSVPVDENQLTDLVNSYLETVAAGSERDVRSRGAELYRLLVAPIRSSFTGISSLVFVPDGPVHHVPMAALFDGSRYLVEDFAIVISPSASVFVTLGRRPAKATGLVLVVANPAFDRGRYPRLENLPHAEREGARLAAHHGGSATVLTGRDATVTRIRQLLPHASAVYFSGHATVNARHPTYSALLLAPDGENDGTFTARDISRLELSQTDLVVLSACSTGRAKTWRVEGESSVAHAFLAAGVPTVLSTSWPVEDKSAADVVTMFAAELKGDGDVAAALRRTQLSFIRSRAAGGRALDWSAFQVVGGIPKRKGWR